MAGDRTIDVILKAKDEASAALKSFSGVLAGVAAAVAVVTAAFAAVTAVIAAATKAASEQEKADLRLAVALASVGNNTKAALLEM